MGVTQKVAVAIVTNRQVKAKTVESLMNLASYSKHQVLPIIATEGYTIAENRNYCVYQALKHGCTHLLFIDDDMTFPAHTLDSLLEHNKPVVGVYSYSRKLPLSPTIKFKGLPPVERPNEPFECEQVGMGVALIDCLVFQTLKAPWFKFETSPTGFTIEGEDGHFCNAARDNGLEIWCDPTIPIGHIGDYEYGPE